MANKPHNYRLVQREEAPDKEALYQTLLKKSLNPVTIIDENGRYIAANRAALDFFECDCMELVGKKIWDFCPSGRPRGQDGMDSLSTRRRTLETHYLINGKIKTVLLNVVPLAVSGEKILYTIGHSITDRKETEGERKALADRCRQTQKMEAIRTLAGGIAHKFNNLLMGIKGYASLMLMDTDTSHPHFERLKKIEGMVKKGADFTRQLLSLAGEGKCEVKPIELNKLIETTSEIFGRTKEDIKIHRKYQKDVWTVKGDQMQIEQVLLNLYVNALEAMPSGGDIFIETENVTLDENDVEPFHVEPGNYVKLSVTDTGVGMDGATQERIFEPFFTAQKAGQRIGLGLTYADSIIKSHGGIITVYSKKSEGATFYLYLPVSEKEAVQY